MRWKGTSEMRMRRKELEGMEKDIEEAITQLEKQIQQHRGMLEDSEIRHTKKGGGCVRKGEA